MQLPAEPASGLPSFVAAEALAPLLASTDVDAVLAPFDIASDIVHVQALARGGLLHPKDAHVLVSGLRRVFQELETGTWKPRAVWEDIHTNVEARLREVVGDAALRIHAGWSRNEQVALDERAYVRAVLEAIARRVVGLVQALLDQAERTQGVIVEGYTHLQPAQPVLLAHQFLVHVWRLARDFERIEEAFKRVNVAPAGSAALAGTSLPIDQGFVATQLGFSSIAKNSVDATTDRDFIAETLFDLALLGTHLSGLGEEIVLWATGHFGPVSLAPSATAGSSHMPQKMNPDAAELLRGKAAHGVANLVGLLALLKAQPFGYNRDLQDDKRFLTSSIRETAIALDLATTLAAALRVEAKSTPGIRAETMAAAAMESLVAGGVPQARAHEAVRRSIASGSPSAAGAAMTPEEAIGAITSPCGTGPEAVAQQLSEARALPGRMRYALGQMAKCNRRLVQILGKDFRVPGLPGPPGGTEAPDPE